ncbi:MAG: hypothetical protein AB7H88_00125 [Vicinamibacterales bacterium]
MDREHVISVVLSDEDWKAFIEAQPQPVEWLRQRIRESISSRQPAARPGPIKH